jgi:hypothetical protein
MNRYSGRAGPHRLRPDNKTWIKWIKGQALNLEFGSGIGGRFPLCRGFTKACCSGLDLASLDGCHVAGSNWGIVDGLRVEVGELAGFWGNVPLNAWAC